MLLVGAVALSGNVCKVAAGEKGISFSGWAVVGQHSQINPFLVPLLFTRAVL